MYCPIFSDYAISHPSMLKSGLHSHIHCLVVYIYRVAIVIKILRNVERGLQLHYKLPLILRHLRPVKVLETVDAGAGDEAVKDILFFQLPAVSRLVATHFNFDGY